MDMQILVVDDEESIRESLTMHFRSKGFLVSSAPFPSRCNGSKNRLCHGLDKCADILIIDQWMPEMTGLEYLAGRHDWGCRSLGQHTALMSASLSQSLHKQAIELGCTVFQKPVRLEQIEDWISSVTNLPFR